MSTSNPANLSGLGGLTLGNAPAPAAAPAAPAQATRPVRVAKPADKKGWWWGTGRRKTAVARLRMRPTTGDGTITIVKDGPKVNKKSTKIKKTVEVYFAEERDRNDVWAPLKITNMEGKLEVVISTQGGGYMAQAGAIRLALSRALRDYDPALDAPLREAGFLTRDAREVERKKYGQAGARRRFQFSKR